jgi:hypothetical protein
MLSELGIPQFIGGAGIPRRRRTDRFIGRVYQGDSRGSVPPEPSRPTDFRGKECRVTREGVPGYSPGARPLLRGYSPGRLAGLIPTISAGLLTTRIKTSRTHARSPTWVGHVPRMGDGSAWPACGRYEPSPAGTIPAGPDLNNADRSSFSRHIDRLSLPRRGPWPLPWNRRPARPGLPVRSPSFKHLSTGLIIPDN